MTEGPAQGIQGVARGGGLGVPGVQGEHLGDPMGPSGWFVESSDDS